MGTPDERAPLEQVVAALVGKPKAGPLLRAFPTAQALCRAGPGELIQEGGLSPGQAVRLIAAAELGQRGLNPPWDDGEPFCEPEDVWRFYRVDLGALVHERLIAVALDAKCRRIGEVTVVEGQLTRCLVDPPQVFRPMLRAGAVSTLLVHNHPSGDPSPSGQDVTFTRRIAEAGRILGISVVDHVIVGRHGYHSMAAEGALR